MAEWKKTEDEGVGHLGILIKERYERKAGCLLAYVEKDDMGGFTANEAGEKVKIEGDNWFFKIEYDPEEEHFPFLDLDEEGPFNTKEEAMKEVEKVIKKMADDFKQFIA